MIGNGIDTCRAVELQSGLNIDPAYKVAVGQRALDGGASEMDVQERVQSITPGIRSAIEDATYDD